MSCPRYLAYLLISATETMRADPALPNPCRPSHVRQQQSIDFLKKKQSLDRTITGVMS
jgi:hypothetical protein